MQFLAADGAWVAAVVPGNGNSRCTQIVLWKPGAAAVTVNTRVGCGAGGLLEGVSGLALGGKRVIWQETNGGNNLELTINTATLTGRKPSQVSFVTNGNGAGGDPAGNYTGHLLADGPLLVFDRWTHCEPAEVGSPIRRCGHGQPDVSDGALHRIVSGRDTVLRRGDDVLHPIWVDGGRILVRSTDSSLLLLRSNGQTLRRFAVGIDFSDAVFQGSRLAVLRRSSLDVYDSATGARLRSYHLRATPRRLVDLQSGVAVLTSGGEIHLLRLDNGRGATVSPRSDSPLHVQLEPSGLFYSTATRITFLPFASLTRRLQ